MKGTGFSPYFKGELKPRLQPLRECNVLEAFAQTRNLNVFWTAMFCLNAPRKSKCFERADLSCH